MKLDYGFQRWIDPQNQVAPRVKTRGCGPLLIRNRHIKACALAKQAMGRDTDTLLTRAGMTQGYLSCDDDVLPVAYFERFLSISCTSEEIASFCFRSAPEDLRDYPGLMAQAAVTRNLREAIDSGHLGAAEISGQTIHTGTWRRRTWLYTTPSSRETLRLAWSPYLLKPLIALARVAAGQAWKPGNILLPCPRSRALASIEFFSRDNVKFDADVIAIEIPAECLDRSWLLPVSGVRDTAGAEAIPSDFIDGLRALLRSLAHDKPLPLSTLAEIFGCSVRTLQRVLRNAGLSYTQLTQEARYLAAVDLLQNTTNTVTDVAYELGYSDPAHFSRAFHRNAGASPRTFRELSDAAA